MYLDPAPYAAEDAAPEGFFAIPDRSEAELSAGPFYMRTGADGQAELGFRVRRSKVNTMGMCHGGLLATFADIQVYALLGRLGVTGGTPTISLSVDFVAPAPHRAWVHCVPELVRRTNRMIFSTALIYADDVLCVRSNGIYSVRPPS